MRKLFAATTVAAVLLVPSAALADHTPVTSENASQQACFGQWRSQTADGSAFAERKGQNAVINAQNKADCAN